VLELDGGERLGQSNAILWYLGEGTRFLPESRLERGQVAQWLSFEQERVMGGLGGPRFRLLTGRATPEELEPRLATGRGALEVLDAHLAARDWLVGDAPTIADLGLFPYVSVSPVEIPAAVDAWLDRVRALPGFVDDFVTYPENARPGAGSSIY